MITFGAMIVYFFSWVGLMCFLIDKDFQKSDVGEEWKRMDRAFSVVFGMILALLPLLLYLIFVVLEK